MYCIITIGTLGHRRNKQKIDACCSGAVAKQSHRLAIPAKLGDIFLDPLQCCYLVEESEIRFSILSQVRS